MNLQRLWTDAQFGKCFLDRKIFLGTLTVEAQTTFTLAATAVGKDCQSLLREFTQLESSQSLLYSQRKSVVLVVCSLWLSVESLMQIISGTHTGVV